MWFLVLSALAMSGYAWFMPKNLKRIEIWATTFFALTLQDDVDIYLDLKMDLYGYFEKGVQWGTLIAFFGIYPAVNTIYLNYYPFNRSIARRAGYIAACSAFGVLYEYAAIKSGFFYHNHWRLWYSAICYPLLFYSLTLVLRLVRKLIREAGSA